MVDFVAGTSLFDPSAYLARNTDVAKSLGYSGGTVTSAQANAAFTHFVQSGAAEGRDPLGMAPRTAVPNTLTQGSIVGSSGSAGGLFDVLYYLSHNADVNSAAVAAAVALNVEQSSLRAFLTQYALVQFVQFGAAEGRNPSAAFSQSAYKSAQSDVNAAVTLHLTTSIQHYLQFGEAEGRPAPAVQSGSAAVAMPAASFDTDAIALVGSMGDVGTGTILLA